jgi:hypothetical protein
LAVKDRQRFEREKKEFEEKEEVIRARKVIKDVLAEAKKALKPKVFI